MFIEIINAIRLLNSLINRFDNIKSSLISNFLRNFTFKSIFCRHITKRKLTIVCFVTSRNCNRSKRFLVLSYECSRNILTFSLNVASYILICNGFKFCCIVPSKRLIRTKKTKQFNLLQEFRLNSKLSDFINFRNSRDVASLSPYAQILNIFC